MLWLLVQVLVLVPFLVPVVKKAHVRTGDDGGGWNGDGTMVVEAAAEVVVVVCAAVAHVMIP